MLRVAFGKFFLLLRKIYNACVSACLYASVNADGGGSIGAGTLLLHPENIYLGKRTYINGGVIAADPSTTITFGNDCMVSYGVHIRTDSHRHDRADISMIDQGHYSRSISIGDNVWIGFGAQIMCGVTVGSNSIVGAGAVVTKDVPENVIVGGVPARTIGLR